MESSTQVFIDSLTESRDLLKGLWSHAHNTKIDYQEIIARSNKALGYLEVSRYLRLTIWMCFCVVYLLASTFFISWHMVSSNIFFLILVFSVFALEVGALLTFGHQYLSRRKNKGVLEDIIEKAHKTIADCNDDEVKADAGRKSCEKLISFVNLHEDKIWTDISLFQEMNTIIEGLDLGEWKTKAQQKAQTDS